jgi:hypothetical protein
MLFDSRDKLLAVEAGGDVICGDLRIEASGQFILMSLDAESLTDSNQLLFVPIDAGVYAFSTPADHSKWRVAIGEIERGNWRDQGRDTACDVDGLVALKVEPHNALALYVLSDDPPQAIKNVLDLR